MIQFTVYGEPKAQGRPKAAVINGRTIMYDQSRRETLKRHKGGSAGTRPGQAFDRGVNFGTENIRPIPKVSAKRSGKDG